MPAYEREDAGFDPPVASHVLGPMESAPSRGLLSNRDPRRGATLVAEKRLERRGTGAFARTPLRPIRLTGCHSDRTQREGGWQNWRGGRVRGTVQNDGVHIEPEPKRLHRADEGSAPAVSSDLAAPVASAPRHGRKIQIRSPSRADAIGLRAALTEGHPCTRGPEKPTEVAGNTHACLLLARDQSPFRNGVSADRDRDCRRRTTRLSRWACSGVPRRCSRDDGPE